MAGQKLRSLQILRTIAASMVVCLHAIYPAEQMTRGLWAAPFSWVGTAGVDIFFVLSGAIIYYSAFAGRRDSAIAFLSRRYRRIAPMFYFTSAAVGLIGLTTGLLPPWQRIVTSITFWPVWGSGAVQFPIVAIGWSLCFEMLFYLSSALVLASQRTLPLLMIGFAASWGLRDWNGWPLFQFLGNPVILEFLLGLVIAHYFEIAKKPRAFIGLLVAVTGFALIFYSEPPPEMVREAYRTMTGELSLERLFIWGIPAALILFGALVLEPHTQGRRLSSLVYIGDASYSVYLTHEPVIAFAYGVYQVCGGSVPARLGLFAWAVLTAIGIAGGVLAYRFIEQPITYLFRRQRPY